MTLKRQYIQVADKKDYFLSCNFKWESQAHQSLRLRTFLFGSVTACEKSTTVSSCGVTSLCAMPHALPLGREPGNLRRFRRASIGWVLLKEVVEFTLDQFLDQIQSAQKCVI